MAISKLEKASWERRFKFFKEGKILYTGCNYYLLTTLERERLVIILDELYSIWKEKGFKRFVIKKSKLLDVLYRKDPNANKVEKVKEGKHMVIKVKVLIGQKGLKSMMDILSGAFIRTITKYRGNHSLRYYETTACLEELFRRRYLKKTGIDVNELKKKKKEVDPRPEGDQS